MVRSRIALHASGMTGRSARAICRNGHDPHIAYVNLMIQDDEVSRPPRDVMRAILRGFSERCPNCGKGPLFGKYLKVRDACPACGEVLHHHRTDDAPPYFTMLVVGHFIVGGALALERGLSPPTWVHLAIWLPLTLIASLLLLPRVKGALVGLQWALYMHGFDGPEHADVVPEAPTVEVARQPRST
jgi:uncharacterized protein (DUF983 family)